ncbi:hypothetical protein AHiyo8_pII70310 (plasmid) [Arthrobacter sp. Hiyo8]|nr:hypothetical protein AHiyo8_pII70220 [Arthrobacter sp. Hiyo8]BAS18726.1 hypothetical protein AHiyo8_pII70310 [Arthrobacter sp. Hiyo8]
MSADQQQPEFVTPSYTTASPVGWLCSKCGCVTVDPGSHNSHHIALFQAGIR